MCLSTSSHSGLLYSHDWKNYRVRVVKVFEPARLEEIANQDNSDLGHSSYDNTLHFLLNVLSNLLMMGFLDDVRPGDLRLDSGEVLPVLECNGSG